MNQNNLKFLDDYRAQEDTEHKIDKPIPTSLAQDDFNQSIHPQTLEKFNEFVDSPKIVNDTIYALPSDDYELINPISVILKIYNDEVIALFPELELFAEGINEFEAVANLKMEILDLFDDLEEFGDAELGTDLKGWKKTLRLLVKKCQ